MFVKNKLNMVYVILIQTISTVLIYRRILGKIKKKINFLKKKLKNKKIGLFFFTKIFENGFEPMANAYVAMR